MGAQAPVRLFVAVDPPVLVRERMVTWARAALRGAAAFAGASAGIRVLDPDTLHLTLCFLGNRPHGQIGAIEKAVAAVATSAQPVGDLALGAPLWLPPRRPRALAVEVHDHEGRLGALHYDLVQALVELLGPDRELQRDRFRPHVTVARLGARGGPAKRELAPTPAQSFTPLEVVLYRSHLSPQGASYEPLFAAALDRSAGDDWPTMRP